MAKVVWASAIGSHNNLVGWRSWMQELHAKLILSGLVQTADSGQLDVDQVTALKPEGQIYGVRLYRFNDSVSQDYPVIIKFEFYSAAKGGSDLAYSTCGIAVSVGSATDGSGNFIGADTGKRNFLSLPYGGVVKTPIPVTASYAIHSEGRFAIVAGVGHAKHSSYPGSDGFPALYLDVCRAYDNEGQLQPGKLFFTVNGTPWVSNYPFPSASLLLRKFQLDPTLSADFTNMAPFIGGQLNATAEGQVQLQRTWRGIGTLEVDPTSCLYWRGALPDGEIFQANVDGKARDYLALGPGAAFASDLANGASVNLAILWDDL